MERRNDILEIGQVMVMPLPQFDMTVPQTAMQTVSRIMEMPQQNLPSSGVFNTAPMSVPQTTTPAIFDMII